MVSGIPKGTGILLMASDDVIIENNIITGNDNVGITIVNHQYGAPKSNDPESDPIPDRTVILDNIMFNNGRNPNDEVKAVMMAQFSNYGLDIIDIGGGKGNTIKNKGQYTTFGLGEWGPTQISDTKSVLSYLLEKPVAPREISISEKSELTYYGICAGCHSFSMRMIGPPTMVIQALYTNNPQGIADYIANPVHKREDYPEMPPQNYLDEETRLAVAEYMLKVKK